jgi:hypothetical protein
VNVVFEAKVYTCRQVTNVPCGRLKPGDFFTYAGEMVKVITVQTECFRLENLRRFAMVTAIKRDGTIVPLSSPVARNVFRPVTSR